MRKPLLILVLAFITSMAHATTHFLDSSVATSGNGLSWATAWKNFSNITGLNPGDVVNISGGASGQTYNTGQFLSASGSSGNPITYQAATDSGHNGVVTIAMSSGSNFIFANGGSGFGQWITFNGNIAGGIVIQGWDQPILADSSVGETYRYTTIKGQIHMNGASIVELDHVTLDLPSGDDRALQGGLDCGATPGYGVNKIHNSIIMLRYGGTSGFGDDGIGGMECTAFYNNQVLGISDPSYPGSQHQDGIQTGGQFVSIYNNFFQNMQNYPVYGDQVGGGTLQHWRVYNNVFYDPSTSAGNQAVSIGCDGTTCTQNDIIVANNTAVANTNCIFLNQGTAGTLTNSFVVNNICYNSGALQVSTATQSNNTTSTSGITFVNPTSDWHLQAGSTSAIGQAISPSYLTSVYTTDKDGLTRTSPWDIGAFEFSSAPIVATPTASPVAGTYAGSQTITLATTTAGATICYTTDGSTPTANGAGTCTHGTTYSTGFVVALGTTVVKAIGSLSGDTDSSVFSATYVITGVTWYVNSGGGNRFSVNVTAGQCNGQSPAAYPGTGVNQNCAFNDIRYLWTDGTFTTDKNAGSPKWGWIGAGGDTYLIDCSGMTGGSCRIGANGPNSGDSFGLNGDPFSAGAPFPPAGSAGALTKIYGINHGACSAKTVVNGGYGTNWAFVTNSFVDIQCIEITDHSSCNKATSVTTNPCSTSYPLSDYTSVGLQMFRGFTNVNIQDVYIHGTAASCLAGPTGDATVLTNVSGSGCPHSTWDMDPTDGTTGTGSLTLNNVNLAFSGLAEVYPVVPANNFTLNWGVVGQVGDGSDQSDGGGYGDCIGTATVQSSPAWIINVNGGSCAYATQDGYDWLHLTGGGSRVTMNRVLAHSNMGQQIKLGSSGSVINSLIVGNCNALRFVPGLAPGAATNLSDWCRAGDMALYVAVANGSHTDILFNTIFTASVIATGITNQASPPCSDATCILNYRNNVMVGFLNSIANGYTPAQANDKLPNQVFVDAISPYPFGGSTYDHNATTGELPAQGCPAALYGETSALCTSPQLVDMTWHLYGFGNMAPASGTSAVVGAGITIAGITTDYNGATRPNPPSIGAQQPTGTVTPTAQFFGSGKFFGQQTIP